MPVLLKKHLKVYIQGNFANRQTARLMEEHPSERFVDVDKLNDADVVVWTGGADINPSIYGSKVLPGTYYSERRDMFDLAAVRIARSQQKIMIGICRGAQLLNCVPNNGKLWQDVQGHGLGSHTPHFCIDHVTGDRQALNSLHHQMMIPGPGGVLVASCAKALWKESIETKWHRNDYEYKKNDLLWQAHTEDPEVLWYPKTKSLCFQPHPEYGHISTTRYFYELLNRYILDAVV